MNHSHYAMLVGSSALLKLFQAANPKGCQRLVPLETTFVSCMSAAIVGPGLKLYTERVHVERGGVDIYTKSEFLQKCEQF